MPRSLSAAAQLEFNCNFNVERGLVLRLIRKLDRANISINGGPHPSGVLGENVQKYW